MKDFLLVKRIFKLSGLVIALLVLSGCSGPSVLLPAGENAVLITNLIVNIFWIAAVVFVVVESLLIYAAFKYSRKKISQASQIEGNIRLEIAWTLVPAIVLVIVFIVTLDTLWKVTVQPSAASFGPNDPKPVTIRVIGHQWWWEIIYPEANIITANEMHVPANTVINLDVESVDVIHSWWVPQLGGKIDAIPGKVNKTWFNANQVGTFYGQCAEFCGVQHAQMIMNVVVDTPEQYQAWVQSQKTASPALTGDALAGADVFQKAACGRCHTINDTTWQGKVGPNLTHVTSRRLIAGGALENTPENMVRWLANPQAVKPGNLMPNLQLSQENIRLLMEFMKTLE